MEYDSNINNDILSLYSFCFQILSAEHPRQWPNVSKLQQKKNMLTRFRFARRKRKKHLVEKLLPKTINLKLFLVVVIQLYRLFPHKAEKHKRMNKILKEFLLCVCEFQNINNSLLMLSTFPYLMNWNKNIF